MKFSFFHFALTLLLTVVLVACDKEDTDPVVITGTGNIQAALDEYRALLGADNGGAIGSQASGRREINWDGVPDSLASPYFLPAAFFNTPVGTRARGAQLNTPGEGVQVSADDDNPAGASPSFGNVNLGYASAFPPFSQKRVFSPIGSNIVDLTFHVPGSDVDAVVNGFGAIYIDVDRQENTAFEYFDINGNSLGTYATPFLNNGHVFLGVLFDKPIVHRVRIAYGNSPLGPDEVGDIDVAVMDDFIFGEPQPAQ